MKRQTKSMLCLVFVLAFAMTYCGKTSRPQTKFAKQKAQDAGVTLTEEQWIAALGESKVAQAGLETLNLLQYGLGTSNAIDLLNGVVDISKVTALIGNDFVPSGIGSKKVLNLIHRVDFFLQQNLSANLVGGGAPPADNDTIGILVRFINGMSAVNINNRVIPLVNNTVIQRDMTGPNDQINMDKIARLIAHVNERDQARMYEIVDLLAADTDVTVKLANIILNVSNADRLVEAVSTASSANMRTVIEGVTDENDLITIIDAIDNGTKLGWLITNVAAISDVIYIINNLTDVTQLASLLTEAESNLTPWTDNVRGPFTWGTGVAGLENPEDTTTGVGNGSTISRLREVIDAVTGSPQRLVDILQNVNDYTTLLIVIADIQDAANLGTLINGVSLTNVHGDNSLTILSNVINSVQTHAALFAETVEQHAWKLRRLIDGDYLIGTGTNQATFIANLITLVDNLDATTRQADQKVGELVDGRNAQAPAEVTYPTRIARLVLQVTNTVGLANIINDIDTDTGAPVSAVPRNYAIETLVYIVKNLSDTPGIDNLITVVDSMTTPQDLAIVINDVSCISQDDTFANVNTDCTTAGPQGNLDAAGQKFTAIIENVISGADLAFVVDEVSVLTLISRLVLVINRVDTANADRIASVINTLNPLTDAYDNTAGNRGTAPTTDGQGKLVNVIAYTTDASAVGEIVNDIDDNTKVDQLLLNITDTSNLVGVLNEVIATSATNVSTVGELVQMLNLFSTATDIPKLVTIVNGIASATENVGTTTGSTDHTLIAELLGAEGGVDNVGQGVGFAQLANLIIGLTDNSVLHPPANIQNSADILASVLTNANATLIYNSAAANVSRREGLARFIHFNAANSYTLIGPTNFGGLGWRGLSNMVNLAQSPTNLLALINGVNVVDSVVIAGCTDHVGDWSPVDGTHDGNADEFNFELACTAIGEW